MSIRRTFLLSASAIALIAGGNFAAAQGMGTQGMGKGEAQPPARQSAPPDAGEPNGHDAQTGRPETGKTPPHAGGGAAQKGPDSGTTGQGAPSRMDQDRSQGGQPPAGARDGQRSEDKKGTEPRANDRKGDKAPAAGQTQDRRQRDTTGQGAAGSSGAANLTAEQRTRIGSSIRQTNVRPVTNVNFNIAVGTAVPRTVELHPLPPAIIEVHPAWRGYRFILVEDEIIIIEPGSYRIVAVIDA